MIKAKQSVAKLNQSSLDDNSTRKTQNSTAQTEEGKPTTALSVCIYLHFAGTNYRSFCTLKGFAFSGCSEFKIKLHYASTMTLSFNAQWEHRIVSQVLQQPVEHSSHCISRKMKGQNDSKCRSRAPPGDRTRTCWETFNYLWSWFLHICGANSNQSHRLCLLQNVQLSDNFCCNAEQ